MSAVGKTQGGRGKHHGIPSLAGLDKPHGVGQTGSGEIHGRSIGNFRESSNTHCMSNEYVNERAKDIYG